MNGATGIFRRLTLLALVATTGATRAFETVVIDPGHGGNDEGTEWRQVSEKELTLAVAQRVERILRGKGIDTVLTRHFDSYVSLDDRAEIANLYPESLLLSIHFNGSSMSDIRGFEIYAFRESTSGQAVAESILQSMKNRLPSRDRGVHTNQDYAVLVRTAGTAVLVECGFISNKAEAARLSSPEGQQALAESIAEGVMRIKPLINTDPEECDIAKCEIFGRKHDETIRRALLAEKLEKARAAKKVTSSQEKRRSNSSPKKKPKST
jgi:N-acetylmuramoyl-L-alanine amidase